MEYAIIFQIYSKQINMSETTAAILNIITMICLITFAVFISAELKEQKIHLVKRLFICLITLSFNPLKEIKSQWVFLLGYPIIIAVLTHVLVLSRQFRIGKMYIRPDISFIANLTLWIVLPMFVLGLMNLLKKEQRKNK